MAGLPDVLRVKTNKRLLPSYTSGRTDSYAGWGLEFRERRCATNSTRLVPPYTTAVQLFFGRPGYPGERGITFN